MEHILRADGFFGHFLLGVEGKINRFSTGLCLEASKHGLRVGDISYPDDGMPATGICPFNGGDCAYSDPYLVFGAEKHGYFDISFRGWMDEIRLSTVLRYGEPAQGESYAVPCAPFTPDAQTAALYHLDSGGGTTLVDATGANTGDVNPGLLADGPQWSDETPFR